MTIGLSTEVEILHSPSLRCLDFIQAFLLTEAKVPSNFSYAERSQNANTPAMPEAPYNHYIDPYFRRTLSHLMYMYIIRNQEPC